MRHVLQFLTRLPLPVLYGLGRFAYFVTYHVVRWHRELAARNLANAFPEKSPEERAALLRQSYRNLGETLAETFWGFGASAEELARRVVIENPGLIDRVVAERRPVVVLVSSRAAAVYGERLRAAPVHGFLAKSQLSGERLREVLAGQR